MSATRVDGVMAAEMMARAIEFCAAKTGRQSKEEVAQALQSADCTVCEYLRYGLARAVAEFLGSLDTTVRAVYTYDPEHATSVDGAVGSPGISLIVWVSRKSAALSSIVGMVGSALAEEHGRLACPQADALCCALDVQAVDDGEVRSRTGYGALVNSLYVRPLEVWRRPGT